MDFFVGGRIFQFRMKFSDFEKNIIEKIYVYIYIIYEIFQKIKY